MVPETSPLATEAAAPPPMDTDVLLLSLLLPQAVRISARAAVPAIHADRTAWVLVIELRSFLGPCGRCWMRSRGPRRDDTCRPTNRHHPMPEQTDLLDAGELDGVDDAPPED